MSTTAYTTSVLKLITSSLRLIGAVGVGEPLDASEANDAMDALNQMVDSWNIERLMIYTIQRYVFNLSVLQQTYTLGPGGNFNMPRPNGIEECYIGVNTSGGIDELPLAMWTDQQWAGIPLKSTPTDIPQGVWIDNQSPLINVNFWPQPSVVQQFIIYAWQALQQFNTLQDVVSFPPGYYRALKFNLAIELAPEFGKNEVSEYVVNNAVQSKMVVRRKNLPSKIMSFHPELVRKARPFNYLIGQ